MVGNRLVSLTTGAAACTVLLLSGCSGSSSPSAAKPGTVPVGAQTPTGSLAPAASSALQQLLGAAAGGPLDVSKLCAAVPAADIQKLFKAPAPAVTVDPGECTWGGGGITVDIFPNDANKQFYAGGGVNVATAKSLSGVGDIAQWSQPVPGMTVPFLVAHKGTTTISISPSLDVDQTTMAFTGAAPFFKVPAAAAAKYAAEEGQICNDMFAAANA